MLSLILRMGGALLFLGTGVALVLLGALFVYALGRRNLLLLRRTLLGAIGLALLYLAALGASLVLAGRHVVPAGQELSFCGFDCHLHVTALWSDGDTVLMRFRSDARAAPEYPGRLRLRAIDDQGRILSPIAPVPDEALAAGDTVYRRVRFGPGPGRAIQRLSVTWGEWPDFLVPGPQNAMAQERTVIDLAVRP